MSSSVIFEFGTVVNLFDDIFGVIRDIDDFGFKERSLRRNIKPRSLDWTLIRVLNIFGLVFIIFSIIKFVLFLLYIFYFTYFS